MEDDNLEHLIKRKDEISRVSTWPNVKLRIIREDIAPLIEHGVPIKHLLKLLEPLEITSRADTLRAFILAEFPEQFARYYTKKGKADEILSKIEGRDKLPESAPKETQTSDQANQESQERDLAPQEDEASQENEVPIENEEPQNDVSQKGGANPITIGQALKDTRNNSAGKHLDNI